MIHNFKLFIFLLVASIGSLIIVSAPSAHAQGEKWELTSKTTIVVSGGLFNGKNGNPSSITLTGNTNTDPVIWKSSQVLNLKDANGISIEGRDRAAGDFCVTSLNTTSLLNNRTSVGFMPIVRGDCNKGAQARFVDQSAGTNSGTGTACASGVTVWACNGIWNTKLASYISPTSSVVYAIPGAPLKCGDIGFVGPCQSVDYATMDCTKTDGTPGQAEKCTAIQNCILKASKKQADCSKAWDDCIASYTNDAGAGYNSCKTAISKGDFSGGKYIADAAPDSVSNCAVDGIGWIVCPIMTSIAGGVSTIFDVVKGFLVFNSYNTDKSSGLYPAWAIMRNFANIAFVIAFMFIIYSQVTSAGISNYGIKKMLPRLIIGAILVNVSYWICGIAVDLSNILGSSLNDLMIALSQNVGSSGVHVGWQDATATILTGTAVGGVAIVSGLAAAGSFGALLWMLVPIVLAALFAVLIAVLILAARQVLLIIFIVISPLAFVAYLLPNTNKWYKKWQDTFTVLLLMFPIIAIVFGGAQFASAIIMSVSPLSMTMVLLALAIQVIPLAITPLVIKFSGGLLGKFAGVVNNPKRGPFDSAKNWAKNKQELATKRGLANENPNRFSIANRLGQRRNNKALSDKALVSTYDNKAQSAWMNSQSGMAATDALGKSELQNQIDKNDASTRLEETLPVNLKLEAHVSQLELDAAKEETATLMKAAGTNSTKPILDGLDLSLRAAAREAIVDKSVASSAGQMAQNVQAQEYADAITNDASLAQKAGGIDDFGASKARASAIATTHKLFDDAVTAEKSTMSSMDVKQLEAEAYNPSASEERRSAAIGMVGRNGGMRDVLNTVDSLGSRLKAANDPTSPQYNPEEAKVLASMQKQFFADGSQKMLVSMTGPSKGAMSTGVYEGSVANEIELSFDQGKYSGKSLAEMTSHELGDVAKTLTADPTKYRQVDRDKLKVSIAQYEAAAKTHGNQPAPEIAKYLQQLKTGL